MVEIKVNDLWFKYPGSKNFILKSLNWCSSQPQAIGILGINGCGKTTFIRLLSGVLSPTKGTIIINQKLIRNANFTKNIVGFVPENAKLFLVGPTLRKDLARFITNDEIIDDLIREYKFEQFADVKLYHLSEGQRRLIAIFIAFQLKRQILFFDEPTIGLDTNGRLLFNHLIQKGIQDGKMIIVSTNDSRILPTFESLLVIRNGTILIEGTPKEVLFRLENETELIPNQIVRVVTRLNQLGEKIPHFISVSELNDALVRR